MWVFTVYGFYSAVRDKTRAHRIVVRSRCKAHLVRLIKIANLKGVKIEKTPDADYTFRIRISHADWERAAALLASDVDYTNFKGAVSRGPYLDGLHETWFVMRKALQ